MAISTPTDPLVNALQNDPVAQVRVNAFRGLLQTAAIPYVMAQEALAQLERGELRATWAEVERIVAAAQGATQIGG